MLPVCTLVDPQINLGAKQSDINTKAGVAETPDQVEGRLAETKISRECAKSHTERGSRVDDTVRIAKKEEAGPRSGGRGKKSEITSALRMCSKE